MSEIQLQDIYDTIRVPLKSPTKFENIGGATYESEAFNLNCFPVTTPDPTTGASDTVVVKRPGNTKMSIDLHGLLGGTDVSCWQNITITALNDVYIAVMYRAGTNLFYICQYRPITGTTTLIGTIAATSSYDQCFVTELTIANVATIGVIWNSSNGTTSIGYHSTSVGGVFPAASLVQIVDASFPPNLGAPLPLVGPMVQMLGQCFVMTNTGAIYNSLLNSVAVWTGVGSAMVILMNSYPDQGIGLVRYKNHLVAFGEDSIEFFNHVGNAPPNSPLLRTDQAFIKFGAVSAKSLVVVDDILYWLGRSTSDTNGLWKLEGYTPVKVSTPREDLIISTGLKNLFWNCGQLSVINFYGQKHLMIGGTTFKSIVSVQSQFTNDPHSITFSDTSGVLTYSISERYWWGYRGNANGSTNGTPIDFNIASSMPLAATQFGLLNGSVDTQFLIFSTSSSTGVAVNGLGYIFVQDVTSFVFVDAFNSGASSFYMYAVQLQHNQLMFNNEKRKRIHKVKLVMDKPNITESGNNPVDTGAWLWYCYTRGQYEYFSAVSAIQRSLPLTATTNRYYFSNLGTCRQMNGIFTCKTTSPLRFRAIEMDLSQGTA